MNETNMLQDAFIAELGPEGSALAEKYIFTFSGPITGQNLLLEENR